MTDHTAAADYQGLLRAVLEDPAADFPRLVLADWLEEHDHDDRAEYIRLGCELATLAESPRAVPNEANRRARDRVEAESKALYRKEWFGPVFDDASIVGVVIRGFVAEVTLTLAAFAGGPCKGCQDGYVRYGPDSHWCRDCRGTGRVAGCAEALFRAHPVERVALTCREPAAAGVPAYAFAWHADHLAFGRDFADAALSSACVSHGRALAGLDPLPLPLTESPQ